MRLLLGFASLSMCCAALSALLREDSAMRRTTLLASGLLLAAMWVEGLQGIWRQLTPGDLPDTLLTMTGTQTIESRQQAFIRDRQEGERDEQDAGVAAP